jgi:hypothetical protein
MPDGPEIEKFVEFGGVSGFFVSEVLGGARGAVDFTRSAQLSGVFPDGPSGPVREQGHAPPGRQGSRASRHPGAGAGRREAGRPGRAEAASRRPDADPRPLPGCPPGAVPGAEPLQGLLVRARAARRPGARYSGAGGRVQAFPSHLPCAPGSTTVRAGAGRCPRSGSRSSPTAARSGRHRLARCPNRPTADAFSVRRKCRAHRPSAARGTGRARSGGVPPSTRALPQATCCARARTDHEAVSDQALDSTDGDPHRGTALP